MQLKVVKQGMNHGVLQHNLVGKSLLLLISYNNYLVQCRDFHQAVL